MAKRLSEIEVNHLSSIVYLDIIGDLDSDIAKEYKHKQEEIALGEIIDYYTAQGNYKGNPEGPKKMEERFKGEDWGGKSELEHWQSFLEELNTSKETDYRNWKISNIASYNEPNESGFVGYTVEPEPGVTVVAFRGSEPLGDPEHFNDWKDDIRFSYSKMTEQQSQAVKYLEDLGKKGGIGDLYITGHSLGGNLALFGAMNLSDELGEKLVTCSTYGAPGYNKSVLLKYADNIHKLVKENKISEYQNKYDPTGSILFNPTKPIYIDTNNPNVDNVTNHSSFFLAITTDEEGNSILKRSEKQEKDWICNLTHKFTAGFEALPAFSKKQLVESLMPIIEKVMNDPDQYKQQGAKLLTSLTTFMMQNPSTGAGVGVAGALSTLFVGIYMTITLGTLGTTNEIAWTILWDKINGILDVRDDIIAIYEEIEKRLIEAIDEAFERWEAAKDEIRSGLRDLVKSSVVSLLRGLIKKDLAFSRVSSADGSREMSVRNDTSTENIAVKEESLSRLGLQIKECGEQLCERNIKELKKLKDINAKARNTYRDYSYVVSACNAIDHEILKIEKGFKSLGNEMLGDAENIKKVIKMYKEEERESSTIIRNG